MSLITNELCPLSRIAQVKPKRVLESRTVVEEQSGNRAAVVIRSNPARRISDRRARRQEVKPPESFQQVALGKGGILFCGWSGVDARSLSTFKVEIGQ